MMKKQTKQQRHKRLSRSKEDVKIRRLIEERRKRPKEERQRLTEVSKHMKAASGTKKNEKTARHPSNIPSQICKEKSAHHQDTE